VREPQVGDNSTILDQIEELEGINQCSQVEL
jgi:hypothetical protein